LQGRIRIENLNESNVDDLIYVCSSKKLSDPIHMQGIELKKQWLRSMLRKYGSCAKIAYLNGNPVAQILYYPEEADATIPSGRKDVLIMLCVYNPTPAAQKLSIGTKLLQSIIEDVKLKKTCLGNKPCKFVLVKAFNTGEFLSMSDFFKKKGFLPTPEEGVMYLPIESTYEPRKRIGEYAPLPEDRNKAVLFYSPICQFSYQFAKNAEKLIKEVAPDISVELIDEWEKPEEASKRKNCAVIVNATAIRTFFMDTERFKEETRRAINKTA
jgi:hypothetical protein